MKVTASSRQTQGTGASRRLRRTGKTPAIVYGGSTPPINIELDHNTLFHALRKEAFHASILELEVDGKPARSPDHYGVLTPATPTAAATFNVRRSRGYVSLR